MRNLVCSVSIVYFTRSSDQLKNLYCFIDFLFHEHCSLLILVFLAFISVIHIEFFDFEPVLSELGNLIYPIAETAYLYAQLFIVKYLPAYYRDLSDIQSILLVDNTDLVLLL